MTKQVVQKIVVAAAVMKNENILLLQRHAHEDILPNLWELPSGRLEPFETSEAGVRREVKEEAGLDIRVIMPFAVFEYQIEKADEIRDTTQINFLIEPIGDSEVVLSE